MRRLGLVIVTFSLLLFVQSCNRGSDTGEEEKNIRQVFEKYLESVNAADVTAASQVWLQSPDLSAVTPLGRFKGWQSVQDDLYIKILQQMFAQRNLKADNIAITVAGDVAWAVYDWTFTAKLANGQPFTSNGWESHVYRKIDGRWVIAHLHYSSPVQPPAQPQ